ncbi:uncharacterized protein LOC105846395 isoform X2 [Hydra vulgaris]|nr:uncharacterized protein LOC105846395 isoform X2 [Hydra vulgaris]
MPDIVGNIASVSSDTQNDCCQYCLDSFNNTLAAFFHDSVCTCLEISHITVPFNGSFYTYITRDPIRLNQSEYECGHRGSFNLLTLYFVVSSKELFYVQFTNMDLNSSLLTSVLMLTPDSKQINYDYTTVGISISATGHSSDNFFQDLAYIFLVGFVNVTTQFALSYTRVTNSPERLIVYLKPFIVVANVKKSQAASSVLDVYAYNAIKQNTFTSVTSIKNDFDDSTADSENVTFVIYFNEKLLRHKEHYFVVSGMVSNLATQLFVGTNMFKITIPRLRIGVKFLLNVFFYSLLKDQQQFESLYHELSAITYQNGTPVQTLVHFNKQYSDIVVQKRAGNRKFIGDRLSLLQFNNVFLVCERAIDRTRNYCGILSSKNTTTFTRLSAIFVEPICFDSITETIYFEDKFGNILSYNYFNKTSIRLTDTKKKVLQLPSLILPFTASKDRRLFCCNTNSLIGNYSGLPYYINANTLKITSQNIFYWTPPNIYIPKIF